MPRYYFHLRDGTDHVLDADGIDLPGPASVALRALKEARGLLGHEVQASGRLELGFRIDVEDEAGSIVHTLPFEQAVSIIHDPKGGTRSGK